MPSLRMHNVINIERMSDIYIYIYIYIYILDISQKSAASSESPPSIFSQESILIGTDQFSMTLPHPLVVPLERDDVTEIAAVCQHKNWGKIDNWQISERGQCWGD